MKKRKKQVMVVFSDEEWAAIGAAMPAGVKLAAWVRLKALYGTRASCGNGLKAERMAEAAAAAQCSTLLQTLMDRFELSGSWGSDSQAELTSCLQLIRKSIMTKGRNSHET